jgi:hypothetical protein
MLTPYLFPLMAARDLKLFMEGAAHFRIRNYGDQAKFALAGDPKWKRMA